MIWQRLKMSKVTFVITRFTYWSYGNILMHLLYLGNLRGDHAGARCQCRQENSGQADYTEATHWRPVLRRVVFRSWLPGGQYRHFLHVSFLPLSNSCLPLSMSFHLCQWVVSPCQWVFTPFQWAFALYNEFWHVYNLLVNVTVWIFTVIWYLHYMRLVTL